MSKPIVFIKIPHVDRYGSQCRDAQEALSNYFDGEYYVLCFPTNEEEMELQVFNDPNLTPANFEQLKEIVENALYDLKYPHEQLPQESPGPGDSAEV